MLTIIIDGYNFLHAVGFVGRGRISDLAKRRQKLLDWIADADPVKADTAALMVVFDAQGGLGGDGTHRGRLEVRFSHYLTADEFIERHVAGLPRRGRLAVVSNDAALQASAVRRGAEAWTCDAFTDWLLTGTIAPGTTRKPPRPNLPEKPEAAESDAEFVARLLDAFSQPERK